MTGKAKNIPTLPELFLKFLKLGVTSFGGPAMVVYVGRLAVDRNRWMTEPAFREGVALCQFIPGATAIQSAGFVGLKTRGIPGAIASFTGFGLPAFLIMLVLSVIYSKTNGIPVVVSLFKGLEAIIVAIVANATITFGRKNLVDLKTALIAVSAAILFMLRIHPILVILLAGAVGLVNYKKGDPVEKTEPDRVSAKPYLRQFLLLAAATTAGFLALILWSPKLFQLGSLMFRIDLFAFGGGFASIPLMLHEFVGVRNWLDHSTFMDGIILGQITPGPIVITATYVGYIIHGIPGAAVATLCVFIPSFLILTGTYPFFERIKTSPFFQCITAGILASFVGLLLSVAIQFGMNVTWTLPNAILGIGALVALLKKVDILWIVGTGSLASVVIFWIGRF